MELEISATNKGGRKLFIDGYSYFLDSKKKQIYKWRCSKRQKYKCKGNVQTFLENNVPKIHVPPTLHTHDPDTSEKHISNTNLFLKNLAQNISNPPSQIIRDAIVTCQPEYRNYMPTKEAQIKKIQRVRKFDF